MHKIREFIRGAGFAVEGIKIFYQTPQLWKYAALPVLLILLAYCALAAAGYFLVQYLSAFFAEKCADLPGFLQWLATAASGLAAVGVIWVFSVLAVVSLGSLYELFGGLFFDALIRRFSSKHCPERLRDNDWKFNCKALADSIIYSANTLLVIAGCLILNLLLPVIGPVIGAFIIGYRFGTAYLGMCGFHYHKTMRQTRALARMNFMLALGYGLVVYILFLLPMAVVLTLPGLLLGGVKLYNDMLEDQMA